MQSGQTVVELERHYIAYHRYQIEREKQIAAKDRVWFDERVSSSGTWLSPVESIDQFLVLRRLFACMEYFRALSLLNKAYGLPAQCGWDLQQIDDQLRLLVPCCVEESRMLPEHDLRKMELCSEHDRRRHHNPFLSMGMVATNQMRAEQTSAQQDEGRRRLERAVRLYPDAMKVIALFEVMKWKVGIEGINRAYAPFEREDNDEEEEEEYFGADLTTLQQVQKQAIYSFVMPFLSVINYFLRRQS